MQFIKQIQNKIFGRGELSMYDLKNFFRLNKIITVLQVMISSLLFVLLSIPVQSITNCKKSLTESSFMQSGYTNGLREKNSFYCEMQWFDLKINDTLIFSDCLMTNENVQYKDSYFTKFNGLEIQNSSLSSSECSISKKTASKYNLEIGDVITVRLSSNINYFTVKYVFDDYYGLHSYNEFSSECLIILGFNEQILSNLLSTSYYTFSDEVTTFASEPILNKDDAIHQLSNSQVLYCSIFISVCIIFTLLIELVFTGKLKYYLMVSSNYGYTKKELVLYIAIDTLYKYGLFGIVYVVIGIVVSHFISTLNFGTLFIAIALNMTCCILSFIIQIMKNKRVL